ncbi:MAG: ABC transporter permease [Lachnospiraceae bacterium]|nr:ABC transporter permease [Lachnospiraceae bacterium]
MKHSRFHGTGKVFKFTFSQMMKAKGFRITLIFMLLVSALYYPISQAIKKNGEGGGVSEVTETSIDTLYVIDESGLNFMDWFSFEKAGLDAIEIPTIKSSNKTYDDFTKELKESEEKIALLHVHHTAEDGTFYYTLVQGPKTPIKMSDLTVLKNAIQNNIYAQLREHMNITEEQMNILNMSIETDTNYVDIESIGKSSDEEDKKGINQQQYMMILIVIMLTTMLVSMSGEYISSSIVQEKSSKVVEFLLTSIRPIALLFGKIAAVFLITLFQIVSMIVCYAASVVIYHSIADGMSVKDAFSKVTAFIPADADITINPIGVVILVCFLLAGMLFFSLICGVIAASVKSVEEMQERMKSFTLLLFLGMFGSMIITIMNIGGTNTSAFEMIAALFPVTSPFLVPGYLFSNRISIVIALIGLVILIACVYFLLAFAARCYEYLIYYNGQKLSIKDYFSIFKNEKGGEKNA